jgi:DNA polymerase III subunit beta
MTKPSFHFSIPVRDLREAVSELRKLVTKRATLPVLATVLIERDKGATRLTATDLDARLTYTIPSDVPEPSSELGQKLMQSRSAREDGAICIPIQHLVNAAKNADTASAVEIEFTSLSYTFSGNKATLGGKGQSGSDFLPAEEFPGSFCKEYSETYPLSETAKQGILAALPCSHDDETRYILLGVYVEAESNSIVATDSKQLIHAEAPLPNGIGNMVMPQNSLRLCTGKLAKHPWAIAVSTEAFENKNGTAPQPAHFQIIADRWTLQSRTIEGNYPNWRQIIPKERNTIRLTAFARATIADLLKRLPKNPADEHNTVHVAIHHDKIRFSVEGNTFDVTIAGMNEKKLRQAKARREFWQRIVDLGSTELQVTGETEPIAGYRNGMTYVFMPLRIASATAATPAPTP